jgi:hypothetical protein
MMETVMTRCLMPAMLTRLVLDIDGEVDLAMSGIMNLVPAGAETRSTSFLEKVEEIGKGRGTKSDLLIWSWYSPRDQEP